MYYMIAPWLAILDETTHTSSYVAMLLPGVACSRGVSTLHGNCVCFHEEEEKREGLLFSILYYPSSWVIIVL